MLLCKPLAVQFYTFRREAAADYVGALETIASLGLEGVEFCGDFILPADELKAHLDRLGLKVAGWHMPMEPFRINYRDTVAYHKAIGNRYVTIPHHLMNDTDDLRHLITGIEEIAPRLRADGLTLGYHNHDHEFQLFQGQYGLDRLAAACRDDLKLELDVYWVHEGGEDPLTYWRRHRDQTHLLHLKDGRGGHDFTALGQGTVDIPALVREAADSPVEWLIIENDDPKPSAEENVRESIAFLKSL